MAFLSKIDRLRAFHDGTLYFDDGLVAVTADNRRFSAVPQLIGAGRQLMQLELARRYCERASSESTLSWNVYM